VKKKVNKNIQKIECLAKEVQNLVDKEFQKINYKLEPNSPLDQLGLQDGLNIIHEYTAVGELGVALEHILYMVHETGIKLGKPSHELVFELCKELQIFNNYLQE